MNMTELPGIIAFLDLMRQDNLIDKEMANELMLFLGELCEEEDQDDQLLPKAWIEANAGEVWQSGTFRAEGLAPRLQGLQRHAQRPSGWGGSQYTVRVLPSLRSGPFGHPC